MLVLYLAVLLGATTAENGTLYCRCGMDHSNPYDDKAKTDCSVIQYHDQVEGVAGVYTGIKVLNTTTCTINRSSNPRGVCRKQVVAYHPDSLIAKVDDSNYDHYEIMWSCMTRDDIDQAPSPGSDCSSATNNEIMCCAHGDNCNDGPESYGPHEKQFYQHRRLKKLEHALFYVLCFFFLFVFFGVFLFWWKPSEVSALFNACCKQWAQRYSQQPNYIMANSHEPYNNREETTNGYSTNVTYINDMPDDSGSGQGNTICTQRTIARQTRIIERVGNGRYGAVFRAIYNAEQVAVKKFYSKEEASWSRELTLYNSQSLAHDNILRFIAADNRDNGTQTELWLITEYHERGSLFDYLLENSLSQELCIKMALCIISGVDQLHKEIQGTATKKYAIAHRDIKSKNILVKHNLDLCIADLGLACFCGSNQMNQDTLHDHAAMPDSSSKPVGTVRYLAPEYLKPDLFNEYLNLTRADIYSTALVIWELLNRTQDFYGLDEPIPEYRQPYYNCVPSEPTIEDMAQVVTATPPKRPEIPRKYTPSNILLNRESDSAISTLVELMQECWQERPSARLTALRLKKDLRSLQSSFYK